MGDDPTAAAHRRASRGRRPGVRRIALTAVAAGVVAAATAIVAAPDGLHQAIRASALDASPPGPQEGTGPPTIAGAAILLGGTPRPDPSPLFMDATFVSMDAVRDLLRNVDPGPAPGAGSESDDEDRPALARASEAVLEQMRVEASAFGAAERTDDSDGDGPQARAESPFGGSAGDVATLRTTLAGEVLRVRDPRDVRASGDAARAALLPEPPAARRLTLASGAPLLSSMPPEGSVTLIGESTLLVRSHGLTVLTDPNFLRRGEPARLFAGLPALRRADPALELDALPPIDVVVLSRFSEDRFDRIVRRALPRDVPIVAPASARTALVSLGFSAVHALPPWGSLRVVRDGRYLELTATPTRVSLPLPSALVSRSMGTLVEFGRDGEVADYRIWVSGDTSIDDRLLAALAPRVADVDLALLHVGGARTLGMDGSMDVDAALDAAHRLRARAVIPMQLSDFGGPAARTHVAESTALSLGADERGDRPRIRVLGRGDVHRFAPLQHWARAGADASTTP